jgi:hypothetical protein
LVSNRLTLSGDSVILTKRNTSVDTAGRNAATKSDTAAGEFALQYRAIVQSPCDAAIFWLRFINESWWRWGRLS